jgi:hypothetical protein
LGEIATTVDVVATAVALQTESATVQNTTSENLIGAMPNINHNPLYYATLQPGVVGRSRFNDTTNINSFGLGVDGRRFFSAISVNGAQAFSADIQVDGLSVQGSAWNEATIIPNQDGLQEVKTITNSYSAEYGRGAGIVQLSTKSGTNEFHGSAAYRARNEAFNANTFDNNARHVLRGWPQPCDGISCPTRRERCRGSAATRVGSQCGGQERKIGPQVRVTRARRGAELFHRAPDARPTGIRPPPRAARSASAERPGSDGSVQKPTDRLRSTNP